MPEAAPCAHCGSPVPAARVEPGAEDQYCCQGCRAAAAFMRQCGLGDFARLRGAAVGPPVEAVGADAAAAAAFDTPAFATEHVQLRRDGLHCLTWGVVGMHCAACVWVLERLPALVPGVRGAEVDLGRGTLRVVYDPARCTPGAQAALAARLGYRLRPWVAAEEAARRRAEQRDLLLRLAVAAAAAVASMNLSMNLWAGELARDLDPGNRTVFGWTALMVALPACLWSAWPIHRAAWAALRGARWTVDLAASLTIALALAATAWRLAAGAHDLYVDAAAMFVALLLGARWTLLVAQERVRRLAGAFDGLLPLMAVRVDGGVPRPVPASTLAPGDVVAVPAGGRLPCDGELLDAPALVDEAVLSGEARPRRLAPGDACYAGCTAREALRLRAGAVAGATRVARLLASGRAGAAPAGPGRDDRLARWFMPALLLAALATGAAWGWAAGIEAGLSQGLAVALAGCPCAIGLAVPLARAAWVARLARGGVLVRAVMAAEGLSAVRAVVFDKTGTLTAGRMQVVAPPPPPPRAGAFRALAERSRHPAAAAAAAWLADAGVDPEPVQEVVEVPGCGMAGRADGAALRLGSPAWCGAPADAGGSLALAADGALLAVLALDDPLHPDAAAAVAAARAAGCTVHLWSGDGPAPVRAVAERLGIADAQARCTPEGKAARLEALRRAGPVAMLGDGVNDAAALARADCAIALRGGLTAALDACHVFVADPAVGVRALPMLLAGTARLLRTQRRLLAWAAAYNAVAVGCAAAGLWGPLVCAVAMPLSSALTIAGALWAGRSEAVA